MGTMVGKILNDIRSDKAKRRRLRTLALILSLFVVTGVVWNLKITGITMTGEALCGYLEHRHTEECLDMVYACGLEEVTTHEHTDTCYQVCTCTVAEHSHGDGCYSLGDTAVCGIAEAEGHSHGDSCYSAQKTFTCTLEETQGHTHGDACYTETDTITCGLAESEEHTHDDTCHSRTKTLTCGQQEQQPHSHGDGCYTETTTLTCGREEAEGHAHGDACYKVLSCTVSEHSHGGSCYTAGETPVCGMDTEQGHTHTEECLRESTVCEQEVHVHTLLCYSDSKADLETSRDWELTIPALTLDKDVDLASVARSQLGYEESQRNYKVASDEVTKMGYTRYGEWYGNPYGDWNAMFASFCLRYSDNPHYNTLKSSGAETMRGKAQQAGLYAAASGTVPFVGDLAFLDRDGNGSCDSVAIVSGREAGAMTVIEGDFNGKVAENRYSLDNGSVMGYALLSKSHSAAASPMIKSPAPGQDQTKAAAETVAITFVINNANYTQDPGNGTTHVTVASTDGLSTDGGLSYEKWAGVYKVSGTGTLATLSIPSGTSAADNGQVFPAVGVTDIAPNDTRTYSYASVYNWVDGNGNICNKNTVFTENTTLYLSLIESGKSCTLNFVCNCDNGGDHSITYYVSGFGSPSFVWGQSIPASNIPTAEAINSKYHSQYCSAGPDHGQEFQGWYLKDANGNEIPFGAGVPILESYKDPNSDGYTVKVYARWGEAQTPTTVTATFVNGGTQTTATLDSGSALGDNLPQVTAPEGQVFVGWQIGDTAEYATAETVIETDTTYTAVFANEITVTFVNGETTVETRKLAENAPLGELPAAPEAAENMTFLGWQAEGMEGYATAEMTVTAPLTFYAKFTGNVTLTFMNNGTQFGDTVKVPQGASVWDYLPQETPEYTGDSESPMAFSGWQINGTDTLVDETTVADASMTLTAVFEEVQGFEIYLHDIAPDGVTDYENEGNQYQVSQTYLEIGTTLAQSLEEYPYHMVHDGADASTCKWYIKQIVDGKVQYVPYDLNQQVNSELHLYTFHYTIVLERSDITANEAAYSLARTVDVVIGDNGRTLTLTLREGDRPTAADFVVNNVDYTLYVWSYTDENGRSQTLDINDIIANGVTENITATSDGSLTINTNTETQHIYFYAIVDGQRMLVAEENLTVYSFAGRWRVSEAVLERIYRDFKLDVTAYDQYKFAFCSDNSNGNLWNDVPLYQEDGMQFVGLETEIKTNVYFYYLPAVNGMTSTANNRHNWDDYISTNSFYSIRVSDPSHLIYESNEEIPAVRYVLTGQPATVVLPDPAEGSGAFWQMGNTVLTGTPNGDGTSTYTFTNVTAPIRITAHKDNVYNIYYDINIDGFNITSTPPNVNGSSTYEEGVQVDEDQFYVVATPSANRFTIPGNASLNTVTFKGWAVNGDTTNLVAAGAKLSGAELKQRYGNDITLTAQWQDLGYDHSVSFYINLELQVADYTGATQDTPNKNYTEVLFGTEIKIDPCPKCDQGGSVMNEQDVIYADNPSQTAAVDQKIRQLGKGVQATYMGEERTFTLGAFPNDETMLAKVRQAQAGYIAAFKASGYYDPDDPTNVTEYRAQKDTYNAPLYRIICGEDEDGTLRYIPESELTSKNYTIRWYILKNANNGWHIDGVLVKKQGQLTVTKTFYGDQTAIGQVKDGYTISVKEGGVSGNEIYTLNLDAKSDSNTTGYTAYDMATDTYTWVIPLTTNKTYTLLENGYTYTGAQGNIATLAEYSIANPEQGTTATNGRVTYSGTKGVTVVAAAYNVDAPYTSYQTVQFYNSYMSTEALSISKVDQSGTPLTDVSFLLYKGDERQRIWRDEDGVYYTYDPGSSAINAQEITTGYITVDSHGYASLIGLGSAAYSDGYTFSLVEKVSPKGYVTIDPIRFSINPATGTNPVFSVNLEKNDAATLMADGSTIRVTNTSVTMDVTAVKKWQDGTNLPVKVQLTLDGTPLTEYAEQTLSADNNWTATWEDVPAYIGGQLANYSVKETWIGSTAYNGDYADGYNDYLVNIEQPTYAYDENELPITATVTVTNQTHLGGLAFVKVDEKGVGLPGALFALYTEECEHMGSGNPCQHIYGEPARSDLHGNVNFGNLAPGTYFMSEVRAPAGYKDNDTVYQVTVQGGNTTLTVKGSDTPISRITNITATANLQIRKVDSQGNPLTGAFFKVYMNNGGDWVAVATNGKTEYKVEDSSGMLIVPNLMPGDYKLVEISAPGGYYRMTEEVEFTVALAQIVAHDVLDDQGNEIPGANSWSFDGETITVVNVLGSELPMTGGEGTHHGTMAGLLMMAACLLYGFLLRRRREGRGAY